MKNEAKVNEEADKQVKERIEKLNMADGLIFNSEKQIKEYAEKIPADKKEAIENALTKLREAHKSEDLSGIDTAMEQSNAAWAAASEHMYSQSGAEDAPHQDGHQQGDQPHTSADGVENAEFEEIK